MFSYTLRNLPECYDHKGNYYAPCVGLTLICSRGMRWDGGEYQTRSAAIEAGEAKLRLFGKRRAA